MLVRSAESREAEQVWAAIEAGVGVEMFWKQALQVFKGDALGLQQVSNKPKPLKKESGLRS